MSQRKVIRWLTFAHGKYPAPDLKWPRIRRHLTTESRNLFFALFLAIPNNTTHRNRSVVYLFPTQDVNKKATECWALPQSIT